MASYPFGYAGTWLTLADLERKATVSRLNPEFWRRVLSLMHAAADTGVALGIGTGWRVQPDPLPPGFAKPGNSNHEGFPVGADSTGAVAADMVPASAWDWMEKHVAQYGLRSFRAVNSEPWHIQPIEIPASRNWRTTPWVLTRFPLPGDKPPPPPDEEDDDVTKRMLCRSVTGRMFLTDAQTYANYCTEQEGANLRDRKDRLGGLDAAVASKAVDGKGNPWLLDTVESGYVERMGAASVAAYVERTAGESA